MNRLLPFALALFAATMFFTACGDDDSSSFVEPEKESSSSEILSGGDGTSDGNGDKSSSSVSSSTTNSSSSAKSSSSTDSMSSSLNGLIPESCEEKDENRILTIYDTGERYVCKSGQYVKIESSSSSKVKKTCSADEEGTTRREDGMRFVCEDGYWVPVESSSSAVPTSSYFDMTNQFNEKVSYGEFTDPRDGHKYRTVSLYDDTFERTYVIFAENLNYGKMVSGGTVQGDSTKYCYDDDPWYCENGWGGLYTWSNAMGFPAVCDSVSISAEACSQKFVYPSGYGQPQNYVQHQGICPEGWHIVNAGEWAHLDQRTGGSVAHYMGSKVAGFGSNNYGLSILPAGYWLRYENNTTLYKLIKVQTFFWSPQQSKDYPEKAHLISIDSQEMARLSEEPKSKRAFSVRCVKNY
ncbi:major paralogous domain-containing protein [Fibrobacter sp. UWH5]|uniref:FISUMP domain-containing protein n=1 Tax=Fibrobacter sp. UWH5 TaxID=1896211 RepID=UPI00091E926E|nr:FISUMP domain-containing protein [Fibrobacter sp. UWH5]SHL41544.1 major paralogous domain-containing protein [Fibrobacter sp. UWH5]